MYARARACVCVCVLSCTYMLLRVCDIACDCTKNKLKARDTKISLPPALKDIVAKYVAGAKLIASEWLFARDKNAFGSSCRDRVSRDNNTATQWGTRLRRLRTWTTPRQRHKGNDVNTTPRRVVLRQ